MKRSEQVKALVEDFLTHTGVTDPETRTQLLKDIVRYLQKDREYYIEAAGPEVPDMQISYNHGVICRLVPLAQTVITHKGTDNLQEFTTTVYLMISRDNICYVRETHSANYYKDREKNTFRFPSFRYVDLADISKEMQPKSPAKIVPYNGERARHIYGMIFMAYAKFCSRFPPEHIARCTERAMFALEYQKTERLELDNVQALVKNLPLLRELNSHQELLPSCNHSSHSELSLILLHGEERYLLTTRHRYNYFSMATDSLGEPYMVPGKEEHKITRKLVTLEDVDFPMSCIY